jgi:anthranilate phosphoribosyltransferase
MRVLQAEKTMKISDVSAVLHTDRNTSVVQRQDMQTLFSEASLTGKQDVLQGLGPLQHVFTLFLENEQRLNPLNTRELIALFDSCSDPEKSADELHKVLHALAPGNGQIGHRQVNLLTEHLRKRVAAFLQRSHYPFHQLLPHDHVFGSGGDFCKTIHASTAAAILAAPFVKICKTGTTNVTSYHGSAQAMIEFGYDTARLSVTRLNHELQHFGFAFIPLSTLGFPYSQALKEARGSLWYEARKQLTDICAVGAPGWQATMRDTAIPLDIFKIVSPNAQVLHPQHHSTGICHLNMLPYVLSLYLHLNSQGIIVYSYDGIDEFATASSNPDPRNKNNLLIWVRANDIIITECSPEDLGFTRATLEDIAEEENLSATNDDLWRIITGTMRGPKRDFLVANAALLLVAAEYLASSGGGFINQLQQAVQLVEAQIDSGKAGENFHQVLEAHHQR